MSNENNTKPEYFSRISIYILFALAVLLAASIIANVYLYSKSKIRIFDTNLGEKIEVEYTDGKSNVLANIVYPSNIVSGTKYAQDVVLKTAELSQNYYVRAKAMYADYNIVGESVDVTLSPTSKWLIMEDNYYYLNAPIDSWSEIAFIEELTLPNITTSVRNNTIITIIFEFLPTSSDVEGLWKISLTVFEG